MIVSCPFCEEKSNPIKGFFSLCKHLIACFSTDEIYPYDLKHKYQYVSNDISAILRLEGLPFKTLQDYLNKFISDAVEGISLSGSISSKDLDHNVDTMETEEIVLNFNYDVFYTKNIDEFNNNFLNHIIELNFKHVTTDLRQEYLLYYLIFDDDKTEPDRKVRPIFTIHGELNLDFSRLPINLLRNCLKEYVNRDLIFKDDALLMLSKDLEINDDARLKASDILWEFLYEEDQDYDNTKWVLRYLRDNYSKYDDFINLFKEIEFREILYYLQIGLANSISTKKYRDDIIDTFNKLKSKKFIHRFFNFFNKPAHFYTDHLQRSGIVRDFRAFMEEVIDTLFIDNGITMRQGMKFNEKLKSLVENNTINQFLQNKLLFLWKQLSTISHSYEITQEHVKELNVINEMFSKEVLPGLSKIFKESSSCHS